MPQQKLKRKYSDKLSSYFLVRLDLESNFNNLRRHDDGVCVGQFFKLESFFRGEFRAHVKLKLNTP